MGGMRGEGGQTGGVKVKGPECLRTGASSCCWRGRNDVAKHLIPPKKVPSRSHPRHSRDPHDSVSRTREKKRERRQAAATMTHILNSTALPYCVNITITITCHGRRQHSIVQRIFDIQYYIGHYCIYTFLSPCSSGATCRRIWFNG